MEQNDKSPKTVQHTLLCQRSLTIKKEDEMKKSIFNFLILICIFALSIIHTEVDAAGYDGDWSGTTNQGHHVSFTVSDDRVTYFKIEYEINGEYCSSTTETETYTSVHIVNSQFTISGSNYNPGSYQYDDYSFSGTFSSSSICNGTWSAENSNCGINISGSWNAGNIECDCDRDDDGRLSIGDVRVWILECMSANNECNCDRDGNGRLSMDDVYTWIQECNRSQPKNSSQSYLYEYNMEMSQYYFDKAIKAPK